MESTTIPESITEPTEAEEEFEELSPYDCIMYMHELAEFAECLSRIASATSGELQQNIEEEIQETVDQACAFRDELFEQFEEEEAEEGEDV